MKVAIWWSGDDDKVKKAGIQHFIRIAKGGRPRSKLQSRFDTLRIGVTHSHKFETDGVLDCLIVLMSNCAIRKETDANSAVLHKWRVYLYLRIWRHLRDGGCDELWNHASIG